MDEQVIQDLYDRAVSLGYKKSKQDFINLLHTDLSVQEDNFSYVKGQGYRKSMNEFLQLTGANNQLTPQVETQEPLKKKEQSGTTVSPSVASSSASQSPANIAGAGKSYQEELLGKNFVQRMYNPEKSIANPDGSFSTHKMASAEVDGKYIAFPTIVEKNGKLVELPVNEAIDYALANNEYAQFGAAKDAEWWASGGYKKGTPLEEKTPKKQEQKPEAPTVEKLLGTITPDLIEKNEEFVVPKMNYQFGPMGFKFEESGATGDWMTVTSPNGKELEVSLDIDFFSPGNTSVEAEKLKTFIRENSKATGLAALEQEYRKRDKIFTTEKDVEDALNKFNTDANSFKSETNVFLQERKNLETELATLNSQKNKNTPEFKQQYNNAIAKKADLAKKQGELEAKQTMLDSRYTILKRSMGAYDAMKEEQGTWIGATNDWLAEGFANISAGFVNNAVDLMFSKYVTGMDEEEMTQQVTDNKATGNLEQDAKDNVAVSNAYRINERRNKAIEEERAKGNTKTVPIGTPDAIPMPAAGQSYKDWWNSLSSDQKTAIVDKSNDDIKKDVKKTLLPAVRAGNEIVWGDDDTTVEFRNLKEEGFWGGAYAGVVKSLPAMIGSTSPMGWAQRTAQMYAQSTDAVYQEMENNPEFADISEAEKQSIAIPIGLATAALEEIGFRNIIANKGLMNKVILGAMGKAGATTTAKTFGELVKNEVNSMAARGALTLAGAALAEAETGAAQQVAEYAIKDIYNLAKEKDMFKNPDFLTAEYVKDVAKAGAQEAVGGFLLGMPSAVSAAYTKKGYLGMDDNIFKAFEAYANDSNLQSAFVAELNGKIASGLMTRQEGKDMLDNYRSSVGLFRELPDNLSLEGKKEAMNLLKERKDLERQVEGKDQSLTAKQRERINAINEELKELPNKKLREETDRKNKTVIRGNKIQVAPPEEATDLFNNANTLEEALTQVSDQQAENSPFPLRGNELDVAEDYFNAIEAERNGEALSVFQQQAREIVDSIFGERAMRTTDASWANDLDDNTEYELNFEDSRAVPIGFRGGYPLQRNEDNSYTVKATGRQVKEAFKFQNEVSFNDNQTYTFDFASMEDVPDQYRNQVQEIPAVEGDVPRKVFGIPIGLSKTEVLKDKVYRVKISGADAKKLKLQPRRAANKAEVFRNTAKSLASIFPDVQVLSFANADEMIAHARENFNEDVANSFVGGENGAIINDESGNPISIFINEESADATTLPHEAWHGILIKAFGDNPELFEEFKNGIEKALRDNGMTTIVNELDAFANTPEYAASNMQAEEWMVQLGGLLTASGITYDNLTPKAKSLLTQIKAVFNSIAVKITGQPIFLEDATPEDILEFMVTISDSMARGEDLSKFFREGEGRTGGEGMRAQRPSTVEKGKVKFQKTEDGEGMFTTRDGVAIGFNYDTDKVARERFDLKSLTKLGEGSDRVVFDLGDNKVLKVAKTARGLEQNIYEGDGFLNFVPEMYERGLNYVVVENVPKMKASDMVPTFDENGDETGTVRAAEMIKDLSKFNQRDFDRNSSELWNTLSKYGLEDIFSYDVLYGDFKAMRNWGYKDGKAYHTDGGTFGGVQMLTSRPSKSLSDAEFRDIYNKSKAAKKKFQDTDVYTKFQNIGNNAATLQEIKKIAQRYNINEKGFGPKQASEQALSRELARFGYSAKRARPTPEGYGGGIYIVDGRGKFFNPFKVKMQRINLGGGRLKESVTTIEGYDRMLEEANNIIEKSMRRGVPYDKIMDNVMNYVMKSKVYERANDSQREQLVRNVRAEFGKREKSAPSVGKMLVDLFKKLPDPKNITLSEKELLKLHFKDLAKGARDAKKAFMLASDQLSEAIKELKKSGKISTKQLADVVRRFSKVDMLNEESVDRFVDYMTKVFNDAEYAEKIQGIRGKIVKARKNLKSKIGIANAIADPMRKLLAVNPMLIPDEVFNKYVEIIDMFSASGVVLPLNEVSQVAQDINEILQALDEQVSKSQELSIRFENYDNKVVDEETGKVQYAETVNRMAKEDVITAEEAELMKKFKSVIFPKEEKQEKTEAEVKAENAALINAITGTKVNLDGLQFADERELADNIRRLLKPELLSQLTTAQLNNLIKLIDNINNGYMPHYGELMFEKLNAIKESTPVGDSVSNASPLSISKAYNNLKAKLFGRWTNRSGTSEMIRGGGLFFIDQVLGNFKSKPIFNALWEKISEAQASFQSSLGQVDKKLNAAQDAVAKSFSYDANKKLESSFRMMAYMIQLEYESNPGSKQVNPASAYIKETIKSIKKGNTKYGDAEIEMLQRILNENGDVDKDALYKSFNNAEKNAIQTIREINDGLTEKAMFTAAVIRGQRIDVLNNYIHLPVMAEYNPDDSVTATQLSNNYNAALQPSSKGKNLVERTQGAKAINFDVFASAQRGAKFTLLDYHMTSPIRTARKTLNEVENRYGDDFTKQQREIFNAIRNGFEESVSNVLTNNFVATSFGDAVVDFISKQGYRAVLAGSLRFIAELSSNVGFALIAGREAFTAGLKYFNIISSPDAVKIMENVKSKQITRLYHGDTLSGRFIDQSVLSQTSGIKSTTAKGVIANKANQIYNMSLKKYKNGVELIADTLISTPDRVIMRPIWFGQFATEFKKQSGVEVDFKKIAEGNEAYMRQYKDAINASKLRADEMSVLAGATDNSFMGILKGTSKANQGVITKIFNNFNNYMTRFAIYEYTTARQGIYAAVGNGSISRKEGIALLAAVTTRMTVYTLMTNMFAQGLGGLLGDEEEEDEKTLMQKLGQAFTSTFTSLALGRNFGNFTKSLISLGVEEVNEEFLTDLRNGDYDPYEDAISFSAVPKEKKFGDTGIGDFMLNMTGAFSPALKTTDLIINNIASKEKKEEDAIERREKENTIRIPLEVLGNMGMIPLYKDVKKEVMKEIYKDLRDADKKAADKKQAEKEMLHGYENREDMKRYDPELYEEVFGKNSPGYDAEQAKKKLKHEMDSLERRMKDEFYDYVPKKKGGFGSEGGFGSGSSSGKSKKKGGFGSGAGFGSGGK